MKTDQKMKCVVVSLRDGNIHVSRCLCASIGEDNSFPLEVPMSEVRRSLVVKVNKATIEQLCGMWGAIGSHLALHGGHAYVHESRVDASMPRGTILSQTLF